MTTNHHQVIDKNIDASALSPGKMLKRARETAELSERDVANSLRLLPDQIRLLEQDACDRFNGALFYKAHLRAYAKLLELDGDKLVTMYLQSPVAEPEQISIPSQVVQIQRPRRGYTLQYWGVAVVVLVSVMLWMTQNDSVERQQLEAATSVVVDSNDQSSLKALEGSELLAANTIESEPESDSLGDFSEQEQNSLIIDLPAGNGARESNSEDTSTAMTEASADKLKFAFSDDCWVEVKDGNGEVIFASLKRARDTLELAGTGPFKVLLGYAHGVSLDYNGSPVEINVDRRNNSARLVVGNLPVN